MEEKKPETEGPEQPEIKQGVWKHDQELSFNRVNDHLHNLKDAVGKAIDAERARLAKMVGAKDLVRRSKG